MDSSGKGKLKMKKCLVFFYLFLATICFCSSLNKEWQCIRTEQKSVDVVESEQVELKKLEQDIKDVYKDYIITIEEAYYIKADLKSNNCSNSMYEEFKYINIKECGFFIIDRQFVLSTYSFIVSVKFRVQ